jgi:hypothetical protein
VQPPAQGLPEAVEQRLLDVAGFDASEESPAPPADASQGKTAQEIRQCRSSHDREGQGKGCGRKDFPMTTTTTQVEVRTRVPAIGVHPGISFAEYAAWDAINWHTIEPYRKSAKVARQRMLEPDDATDAQVFGAAFHAAILEPERFDADYAIMPQFDGHPNSNAYKAKRDEWVAANADKVHLSNSDRAELLAMQAAVNAHPKASAILACHGKAELSIAWDDRKTGRRCKGRIDKLSRIPMRLIDPLHPQPDSTVICLIDVKMTRAIDDFERENGKYGYHGQIGGFYRDGLMTLNPVPVVPLVIAVENKSPNDVLVYQYPDDSTEEGQKLYRRLLGIHLNCERDKRWPGISDAVLPLFIPPHCREIETKMEDDND